MVKFALDHGQPIDSVLNGVLPIHAACINGNVNVVQYLIERGANVNSPRYVIIIINNQMIIINNNKNSTLSSYDF